MPTEPEASILTSTKKILNIHEDYTVFDLDIITAINGALSTAEQSGAGLAEDVFIIDDSATWEDLDLDAKTLSMLKNYVYLKSRMIFDPPSTSFAIEAMRQQIEEMEYRMKLNQELKAGSA